MTESLADGPRLGISDLDLVFWSFTFLRCRQNEAAPRSMNSIVSILEDKVLMMTHLDLQNRFPINHVCFQMLGGPSLRLGTPKERL